MTGPQRLAPDDQNALDRALASIGPLDAPSMARAAAHLDGLTKPPGSLGRLETTLVTLAGITGRDRPTVDRRAIVIAAGDHGVTRHGVSAYPSAVTAQMVANFVAGGAAINALAAVVGASVTVVDVGVAGRIPRVVRRVRGGRLIRARIRDGTADMTVGPAMSRADTLRAIHVGLDVVAGLDRRRGGVDLIGIGEMGIGNTTASSAIATVMTGGSVERMTGRGTGIDDAGHRRKIDAIQTAIAVNRPDAADPIGVLAAVGGFEIAVLVGAIVGASSARIPVLLDGFISGSAALIAQALAPAVASRCLAAHVSSEPGHAIVLERLGLLPMLDLDLRLGEGTGAALAMGLIVAAVRARDEMATFQSASVSGRSPS